MSNDSINNQLHLLCCMLTQQIDRKQQQNQQQLLTQKVREADTFQGIWLSYEEQKHIFTMTKVSVRVLQNVTGYVTLNFHQNQLNLLDLQQHLYKLIHFSSSMVFVRSDCNKTFASYPLKGFFQNKWNKKTHGKLVNPDPAGSRLLEWRKRRRTHSYFAIQLFLHGLEFALQSVHL